MTNSEQAYLVTTSFGGVFFGYAAATEVEGDTISLSRARNCLFWPREARGFLGLASAGPPAGSRVGPAVDSVRLRGVTCVAKVSDEARVKWETAPWSE